MEQIKNKKIIYNYGHGGAGISMSPGCGAEAAEIAAKNCQ
jgi:glycine/D-amino acid oxidase-like deaminating enzyme